MYKKHHLLLCVLVSISSVLFSYSAFAWTIRNNTNAPITVRVWGDNLLGDPIPFPKTIAAGGSWTCTHIGDDKGNCYREGTGFMNARPTAWLAWSADGRRAFTCRIFMPRNGSLDVFEQPRDSGELNLGPGYPPDYYCISRDSGTAIRDRANQWSTSSRHVRFLASGDPQMDNGAGLSEGKAAETQKVMYEMARDEGNIRDILVAGDLTMNTRTVDEFDWYLHGVRETVDGKLYGGFVGGAQPQFYEGLGNHDVYVPNSVNAFACAIGWVACQNPRYIRNYIRNKYRWSALTARDGTANRPKTVADSYAYNVTSEFCGDTECVINLPNYSWDWHDVHFVNLNIVPGEGNKGVRGTPHGPNGDGPVFYDDHFESLTFLRADLATYVGNSDRPVVLMQHYGIKHGDWTPEEKEAFWDVIANYNMIAVISGHAHLYPNGDNTPGDSYGFVEEFARPAGRTTGPDKIDGFNASASHRLAYLDVTIDDQKMVIKRKNTSGDEFGVDGELDGDPYCKLVCANQVSPRILIPADQGAECSNVPAPPAPGTVQAFDACGVDVSNSVAYKEVRVNDGSCVDEYTLRRTWSITDACGVVTSRTQVISVGDTTPPDILADTSNQVCLSPPNHRMADFSGIRDMVGVADNCDPAPVLTKVSCVSNQSDNAPGEGLDGPMGDGNTIQDCSYDWDHDVLSARAERAPNSDGRTYSAMYTALDRCGNENKPEAGFWVNVKRNQEKGDECLVATRKD